MQVDQRQGSERSAPPLANDMRSDRRTKFATGSAESAPKLPTRTTESIHQKELESVVPTPAPAAGLLNWCEEGGEPMDPDGNPCEPEESGITPDGSAVPSEDVVQSDVAPEVPNYQEAVSFIEASDEVKEIALRSAQHLEMFLLWGEAGTKFRPNTDILMPANTNWRFSPRRNSKGEVIGRMPLVEKLASGEQVVHFDRWSIPQFMGFYWFRVANYREKRRIPLTLPQWPLMAGHLKNVGNTMSRERLYSLIGTICQHFDLIRFHLRSFGENPILDECTLALVPVRNAAEKIQGLSEQQVTLEYNRLHAAVAA